VKIGSNVTLTRQGWLVPQSQIFPERVALVGSWRVGNISGKITPDEVTPDEEEVMPVFIVPVPVLRDPVLMVPELESIALVSVVPVPPCQRGLGGFCPAVPFPCHPHAPLWTCSEVSGTQDPDSDVPVFVTPVSVVPMLSRVPVFVAPDAVSPDAVAPVLVPPELVLPVSVIPVLVLPIPPCQRGLGGICSEVVPVFVFPVLVPPVELVPVLASTGGVTLQLSSVVVR
jgi:hypothetical protein